MTQTSELRRAVPTEEGLRLLLDPYLCFGPGTERHRGTLAEIAHDAADLRERALSLIQRIEGSTPME